MVKPARFAYNRNIDPILNGTQFRLRDSYTEHCSIYQAVQSADDRRKEICLPEKPEDKRHDKPARRMRADASRNEDAVLEAAKEVFTRSGVDAPVREIAARANVGVATLYRRFPSRSDLVAAVFRREVDACAAAAGTLAGDHPPVEALILWLKRYTDFLGTKKGLAAALHSGNPAFDGLPGYFRAQFEPALAALLDAAASAGEIRGDIEPYDLLRVIGNLSAATGDDGAAHSARMLNLLIDGLRHGAKPPAVGD